MRGARCPVKPELHRGIKGKYQLPEMSCFYRPQLIYSWLTQYALVGTWNYSAPGVKFEGNDLLSQLGGSALEGTVKSQLDKVYQLKIIRLPLILPTAEL